MNIGYGRQFISQEDIDEVVSTLTSDYLTQGPKIHEFEKSFASYVGSKYAVAVSNGTAALHLCAMAFNVKKDDVVITTPVTFAASANCVLYCGGKIEFADIDPNTFLIDIPRILKIIHKYPKGIVKGIIPVDMAGYPVNLEELKKITDKHGMWILEDACHALGGYFIDSAGTKQLCGNGVFANASVFSFHPVKHITTGEGGMITTNRKDIYEKLLLLRTHGITKDPSLLKENHGGWYYEMQELGFNYRLTDFQAALGNSQLKNSDKWLARRRQITNKYFDALKGLDLILPAVSENVFHAYHLFVIQTRKRLELYNYLKDHGIHAQVHYIPVHMQPYYRQLGWKKGDLPHAEKYYDHCLSLPMYPSLKEEELDYVIQTITNFFKK